MPLTDILIYIFLILSSTFTCITRKLTPMGAVTGAIVGFLIYKGAGLTGMGMLGLFFIAGTLATGWQSNQKHAIGLPQEQKGSRTAGQVLANGGVAALCGIVAWYLPDYRLILQLMIAGSLASATADTLSSELGTVYGSSFYNVLTFKKNQRGLDGVVSLEGTLIGVAGAGLIGIVYAAGFGWNLNLIWIVLAGFIGNLSDSVLGATLERKQIIGNNLVNLLNTAVGALVCLALSSI